MKESEIEEWMDISLEDITKMNMISQIEFRAKEDLKWLKEHDQRNNNAKHIIYAAIISGSLIGIAGIIAGVLK